MKKGYLRVSLILFILSFFIYSSLTAKKIEQKTSLKDFPEFVDEIMKEWKVPGLAIAIVKDREVIFSEGFGFRDVKRGLKVSPQTIFAIGSCTKAFTATCVGMLVDEEKLDWDKPVREYLPSFKLYDLFATERMTPRDLVCHRSGLPRHGFMWVSSPATRKELFDRLQYLEPSKDLRSTYQYNNLMYMVAGDMVGQIAGTTWEDFVQKRIFNPSGMKDSNVSLEESQKAPDFALPYMEKEGEVVQIPFQSYENAGPCGSINSNITDMAKWILLNLNKGKHGEKQIISEDSLKEIHSPQIIISKTISDELFYPAYGMGWGVTTYRGHLMLSHTGGALGLNSLVSLMPRGNIGLVILTNMQQWRLAPNRTINYNVYDRLLGLDQIPWNERFKDRRDKAIKGAEKVKKQKEKDRKLNTKPSHPLADYVGDYHDPGYGIISIEKEGNHLKVTYNSNSYPLTHYHYDVFEYRISKISHWYGMTKMVSFFTDTKGNIQSLAVRFEPAVKEIVFTKVPEKK